MVVASLQFSSEFLEALVAEVLEALVAEVLEALVAEVLEAVSKCQSILIEYQQYSQFKNPLVECLSREERCGRD